MGEDEKIPYGNGLELIIDSNGMGFSVSIKSVKFEYKHFSHFEDASGRFTIVMLGKQPITITGEYNEHEIPIAKDVSVNDNSTLYTAKRDSFGQPTKEGQKYLDLAQRIVNKVSADLNIPSALRIFVSRHLPSPDVKTMEDYLGRECLPKD
ncbi:MAG: hypothetical protein HY438_00360 [DPANN group archaeon]|nr:hypothetical protein [DPANN group archaeon]